MIGFNPNMVKLSVLFAKGLCPVTIISMTKLCKGCLYGRQDGTFAGAGRLLGRDVCRGGTFAGPGRLPGRDVC